MTLFSGQDSNQEFSFLQDFKMYLKLLKFCKDRSTALPPDSPLTKDHFLLLHRSPVKLFSDMVIEEGMTSTDIEKYASLLGFNLPHILSSEICSTLDSVPHANPDVRQAPINSYTSVSVLNSSNIVGPARHPAKSVEGLLMSVHDELKCQLELVQKLHKSKDGHLKLHQLNIKQMQSVLAATWELQYIDIRLLQPGAQTLVFYCNLANLIWVHCLVYLSSAPSLENLWLKSLVGGNNFQQMVAMNSFAYQVGTLGIMTLWEVRQLALGVKLMRPMGTPSLQSYAPTTDSFDPLSLFVVSSGSKYSPKLEVLSADNLEKQLQKSVHDYIQHWIDIQTDRVSVPSLVYQYIHGTGQNMCVFLKDYVGSLFPNEGCYPVSCLPDEEMSNIVLSYGSKMPLNTSNVDEPIITWRSNRNLCNSILQYIKSYSPVVSLLLCELLKDPLCCESPNESDDEAQEALEGTFASNLLFHSLQQFPCLERICKRIDVVTISEFFHNNTLLCSLHSAVPKKLIWSRLDVLAREQKWEAILDLLKALSPLQTSCDPMLSVALDLVLLELTFKYRESVDSWLFCEQIKCIYIKARCVISESIFWPGEVCIRLLKCISKSPEIRNYPDMFFRTRTLLDSITIYQKLVDFCGRVQWNSWQEVRTISQTRPAHVLEQIVSLQNVDICVAWLDLLNISEKHTYLIDTNIFILLLNDTEDRLQVVEKLLLSISNKRAAKICFEVLGKVYRLPSLQFCIRFLKLHCMDEFDVISKESIETIFIGIQMLKSVPVHIQSECLPIVCSPHLMLEQLIMNVQLEAAEQMLFSVRGQLLELPAKSPLSIAALDSMFRQYAEKALEFGITKGSSTSTMSERSILDSLSSFSGNKDYTVPSVVPTKIEWVPNEQASVCMDCQIATFTMFNRRHHCRRCGRVVCAQCSPNRMLVQGYGTLKVRVCNSCHSKLCEDLVTPETQTSTATESFVSIPPENVWRLSNDSSLNDTIRGEFAFEHAPSVSLCLSILKLHSESAACPNFLVDSCETILSYLSPHRGVPNPEADYGFVIEMCRSLVVAAKVKCAQWGYISDEPNCDQRLSKIDLLSLLVTHGCAALIPDKTSIHGLRRLQTQLLESELWQLALEVSTKAGLEKIGVWTSWGKALLRGGQWKEARDKFSHCFPISSRVNKSGPDAPLLTDILQILENSPLYTEKEISQNVESINSFNNRHFRSPAIAVLNSLSSLKSISQGKFIESQAPGTVQPQVYAECCYYLKEYGSHASYLQFLVRHTDFKGTVEHTLSYSVDPQIFFENVYMPCLRRGQITPLHSAITVADPSLAKWTIYLRGIGSALEKRKLLNTLYEVQRWSKDHVRAAMTCIRFYHLNASSYTDLVGNINHLTRAQLHLEDALAVATASPKLPKHNDGTNFFSTEKCSETLWLQLSPKELDHHLSTIELQKELTKFLSAYEANGHTLFEAAFSFPHVFAEPLVHGLPTLFGSTADRLLLSGLCLFCGKNVEEGYGIVFRIIEGFHLPGHEIYEAVAVALFHSGRLPEISQLLNCIRSSGVTHPSVVCDSVIMACVRELPRQPNASEIDFLARNIYDQSLKIQAFISCGQLKSAYLLAVKYERLEDIEKILEEAERLGQSAIKNICLKRLGRL
ncbi:Zinc finger FYVE domain-containing protein 26 [Frankliniella fusca]|uniref:Zinc finger FYVE domain-containing protein 26 n=1 Tax=Frankliniella fusca TaxID=407009 RepID=A0AAE1H0V5_9NEOP|nr:Zinc finger FYVE domain-containing protein 26 [Frankliniella fusca]